MWGRRPNFPHKEWKKDYHLPKLEFSISSTMGTWVFIETVV